MWLHLRTIVWFHLSEVSRIISFIETESRIVIAKNWKRKKKELLFNGNRDSVLPGEKYSGIWLHKIWIYLTQLRSFPIGTSGKEPGCPHRRCGRPGFSLWVGKISWRRKWKPTPVFLPGESHGQRSVAGLQRVWHDSSDLAHKQTKHDWTGHLTWIKW